MFAFKMLLCLVTFPFHFQSSDIHTCLSDILPHGKGKSVFKFVGLCMYSVVVWHKMNERLGYWFDC